MDGHVFQFAKSLYSKESIYFAVNGLHKYKSTENTNDFIFSFQTEDDKIQFIDRLWSYRTRFSPGSRLL